MYVDHVLVEDEEALVIAFYVELAECTDDASDSLLRLVCVWRSLNAPTVSTRLQLWEHRCGCRSGLNGCVSLM